jgi:PAS domain-containing protein
MTHLLNKQALHTNGFTKSVHMNVYETEPVTKTLTNGFFTVDNKWIVKYWNKAAEKILGIKSKDIIGKNLWEKFEGIIPLEFFSIDQSAFLQDTPLHFEKYWGEMGVWFDVITYHCDDSLSVSFKSSKHPHAKINHKKRLKILAELYCFVTEITNDCLWEWNLETGEIFWIDGGHKRMFGYPVENALIPQGFWESRIHPDDKERVLRQFS